MIHPLPSVSGIVSWTEEKALQNGSIMKSQEAMLRRRDAEIKSGQDALALALTKTLVLRPHQGNCACGMMLTEQDRIPKMKTYRCPRCGKTGPLAAPPARSAPRSSPVSPAPGTKP